MGVVDRIAGVGLLLAVVLSVVAGVDRHHPHHRRHRHRRQQQHRRRNQGGERRDMSPAILPDTPIESILLKYHSGPTSSSGLRDAFRDFNKAPKEDLGEPLTPGQAQIVFVDFLTGTYFVTGVNENDPNQITDIGPFVLYDYSPAEKAQILTRLRADFNGFAVEFVTTEPDTGSYTILEINANTFLEVITDDDLNILAYSAILFGEADGIDFLNQITNDSASVDANFWALLVELGDDNFLYSFSGLDPVTVPIDEALSTVMVTSTANTAAHELGHLLGLRHYDSIGAPGDGLSNAIDPLEFVPIYTGPFDADETFFHLLASGSSVGLPLNDAAGRNRFFSERSSLKLSLALSSDAPIFDEESIEVTLELSDTIIPNTILEGENAGPGDLQLQAALVRGRINVEAEVDTFRFFLEGGRALTAEVISIVDATQFDDVITRLSLYRVVGDELIAQSSQEFESFDPLLWDIEISTDGLYEFRVDAPRTIYVDDDFAGFAGTSPIDAGDLPDGEDFLTGDYQLLIYSYEQPLQEVVSPPTGAPFSVPTLVPTQPPTARPTRTPSLVPTRVPTTEEPAVVKTASPIAVLPTRPRPKPRQAPALFIPRGKVMMSSKKGKMASYPYYPKPSKKPKPGGRIPIPRQSPHNSSRKGKSSKKGKPAKKGKPTPYYIPKSEPMSKPKPAPYYTPRPQSSPKAKPKSSPKSSPKSMGQTKPGIAKPAKRGNVAVKRGSEPVPAYHYSKGAKKKQQPQKKYHHGMHGGRNGGVDVFVGGRKGGM